MAGPADERAELERLRKLKRLRELEAKAAGAAPAQPTSPFLQRGMDMVRGAQATSQAAQGANQYLADTVDAPRERAGIESGADAFLFNVGNVLSAGGMQRAGNQVVPGKELGDTAMREAEVNYPMASVVGRGVGYAAPASQGGRVASMATQDLITATGARALAPKALTEGTGALARTTRYGGRLATLAPQGAAQVGLYEGLVEQPVRDFMAGEEGTIGGRVQAGVNALANPINYGVLPVASMVGRVGKALLTGVATPGDVQRAVSAGSRGAVPLSEGQLAADAAQILDTQAMNAIDPRGFKLVERILRQSGVADSDVPAVNAKVREILEAAPDAVAGRLTVGQVYAKALYDLDKTQASENILKVLRERRNVTDVKDRSPSIVGNEVRDLRSSQVDFVTQSAESNLGAGRRIDIKNAVADTKKQIGTEYERVLAEADPTRPEAPALASIVIGDASKGILARRAKNAGFEDVDAYAAARPDEAAHWLRSHLDKAARSAQGRERVDLENTVSQLDELLDTNPGYAQARQQYGTEMGVDRARDIGSNFITAARNQGNLDLLLEQIAALPARERDVALLAIRDNLLSPVRGSGEDAPARISQLISVGTLEGIERLGPAGKNLADDLRAIRDENAFLGQIDSGNPLRQSASFSNFEAKTEAPDLYSGGMARAMNAGGGSSLPADIAVSAITGTPIAPFTMAKIARSGLQSIFAPSRQSKEAMTQFLMSRPRNALGGQAAPPSSGPDIMPTAGIATGAERAAEASPNALAPQGPIRAAGFTGYHGTQRKFDRFDLSQSEDELGVHFGTKSQAEARNRTTGFDNAPNRVIEAEIQDGNYLELPDLNLWRPQAVRQALSAKGIDLPESVQTNAQIRDYLASQGYDGIRYANRAEGAGESVIVFDPNKASIIGESSTPMSLPTAPANRPNPLRGDLGSTAGQFAGGALTTGAMPVPEDTPMEARIGMALTGGLLAAGGGRYLASRIKPNALADDVATAGAPKTAQQAAKFETPGSPEWEAAKAKGLDMSQAGRMARAKEMGFDTDTVLYHGTDKEITDFRPSERGAFGPGVYLSEQSGVASRYGPPSKYHVRGNILDTRPGKPAPKGLAESAKSQLTPEETQRWDRLWPQRNTMAVDAETFREVLTRSVEPQRVPEIMRRLGFDGMQGIADGHELVIFDPSNIRSVNAAFDPDKAASPILTAGVGGPRKPRALKPDSPEAIKAALKGMAKDADKQPTRLEQMVDAGKDASVPPVKSGTAEEDKLAAQATRMLERGDDVFKIHDKTGVVMIPYNNSNVPLYAPDTNPERAIRMFYEALSLPFKDRPEWVRGVLSRAQRKSGLLLTDRNIAPPEMVPQPPANALANLPPERFPVGAVVGGALGGAATGIAGGVAAIGGYQAFKDEQRKRNALAQ